MFERMKISTYIYEGVVEPSYKKTTKAYANCSGNIRLKKGEAVFSNTYSKMSESSGNFMGKYVYHPKDDCSQAFII